MADTFSNFENLGSVRGKINATALEVTSLGNEVDALTTSVNNRLNGTTAINPNLSTGLWRVGGVAVTSTAAELNILDGVTASTAELNILDGVTASTAELNILDGVTASAAELNVLDGIAGIASQAEAEAGTDATKLMTPQRTAQAIAILAAPSGAVMFFATSSAPTGWLKANGALVSRTTYAALFSVIGTTYGAGDGSTTFALPDLRGEFLRAWDDGRGVDSGRGFGTAQSGQNASHSHTFATGLGDGYGFSVSNGVVARSSNTTNFYGNYTTDASGGTEARPRNIAFLACIKF